LGVHVSIKSASQVLAATVLLTACKHGVATRQAVDDSQPHNLNNPVGYIPGHPPSSAEQQALGLAARTLDEVAADEAMAKRLIGTWTSADDLRWARYHVLTLRDDCSFMATNGNKEVSGAWRVDRGILLLTEADAKPFDYFGFHSITLLDDHQLVCGIDMSVAGRWRFTR
jgi:hypothetical protein